MDKLTTYRIAIKTILEQYYRLTPAQSHQPLSEEVSDRLAFDDTHDHYLWFRFGWDSKKLVQHIIIYISVKHTKIWVEQDNTDLCIVDDLLAAGIPAEDIVLGFHHPSKRALTEFAIA
jgi:hypothetical protein